MAHIHPRFQSPSTALVAQGLLSTVLLLLVGGLGGKLVTGRVLDYLGRGDDNRKLCSLYLSLMDRMGVKLDRFGDAATRLAGL